MDSRPRFFSASSPAGCDPTKDLDHWKSKTIGRRTTDQPSPSGKFFTLYKLPPLSADLPNDGDGPAQYAALCAAYGMAPVGPPDCSRSPGRASCYNSERCDLIAPLGGMCMPVVWENPIGDDLRERTGWGRVAFFRIRYGLELYSIDSGGDETNGAAAGFSPVCAIGR